MHDLALLKQLTREQCKFVLKHDPCLRNSLMSASMMVQKLKEFGLGGLINDLLLSWGQQLEKLGMLGSASDYYGAVDDRCGTKYQFEFAVRYGLLETLNAFYGDSPWYVFVRCGYVNVERERYDDAIHCYLQAMELCKDAQNSKNAKTVTKALRRLLNILVQKGFVSTARVCMSQLQQDEFTQPQKRALRRCAVDALSKGNSDWCQEFGEIITRYGSESDKRQCLKRLVPMSIGHAEYCANVWHIPLTEHHWRLALGSVWYTQLNGGNANERVRILRKLDEIAPTKYQSTLTRAIRSARFHDLAYGEIVSAHEYACEINEPLTLEELEGFMKHYAHDDRRYYRDEQVPFAIGLMLTLIGPKSDPTPETIAHAQPATV